MNFENIYNLLIGNKTQFSLQQRVIHIATLFAWFATFITLVYSLYRHTYALSLICFLMLAGYSLSYFLSRLRANFSLGLLLFSFTVLCSINIIWVIFQGSNGPAPYFFFQLLALLFFSSRKPITSALIVICNLILLCSIEDLLWTYFTFSLTIPDSTNFIIIMFSLLFVAIICHLFKTIGYNKIDDTFFEIMDNLNQESELVGNSATAISISGDEVLKSTFEQKTAIEELAVTAEQLGATAEQNSHHAGIVKESMADTKNYINQSKNDILHLEESIKEIQESSEKIQLMNDVINNLSYQTHLLSLNAMIEASRAGDDSGGFKVVANEVKKLAAKSTDAAADIDQLLKENFASVKEVDAYTQTIIKRFDDISNRINKLAESTQNVSDGSHEQMQSIKQISLALMNIDRAIDNYTKLAQNSSDTAQELNHNAENLSNVVKKIEYFLLKFLEN